MARVKTIAELFSSLRRFARDTGAVSAIEFAIVLPFMLSLYVSGVELGDGLAIQFKVTETARTVTDLASQYASINTATMNSILAASSTIVAPYPSSNLVMTVSEVTTNAQGQGTITWSCSLNGTARTAGVAVTLPVGLQIANASLLWGEVMYPYTPAIGYYITGTINIYQTMYFYPRLSSSVTGPGTC
jgi:Flp pilus assembly protein TadG